MEKTKERNLIKRCKRCSCYILPNADHKIPGIIGVFCNRCFDIEIEEIYKDSKRFEVSV